ncbi:MAG TPA: LbtU family siderophore porin [Gammaproteobacteria bacterium]|jgi:hypothetical protein|nr:LbtU family siderophore porin [Gammaproteobacteria bacterium]
MKARLKIIASCLAAASVISAPVFATVSRQEVQDLSEQATKLKKTVATLQNHVDSLERQVNQTSQKISHSGGKTKLSNNMSGKQLVQLIHEEKEFLPFDLDVPGQAFVSSGPYVGVPFQFAGNDLVVNSPSVNRDVQLLNIRKSIMEQLKMMGGEITQEPYHSHILLSGLVEGAAEYFNPGGSPSTTDINLSSVSLDTFVLGPSPWILGFVELNYNDVPPVGDVFGGTSNYRISDSRVFVNMAFVTFGNFTQSPFYGTFGQYYVPFGVYSSVMVSSPLTKILTRTKARSILLGFMQQDPKSAFYGSVYVFRGDSHAASVAKVNNGGLNLGYKFKGNFVKGKFGAGVIGNIADSGGMQTAGNFQNAEQLVHRVPGYDLNTLLSIGDHLDLIGEFVMASTSFNPTNMSYNGNGAKPWAFDLEAAYSIDLFETKPSSLGIGYSQSHEALALGLPLNRISVVVNTSWWRNTLQSLEFRRDHQYAASDTASGGGGAVTPAASGKIDRAVTAQFDYYF